MRKTAKTTAFLFSLTAFVSTTAAFGFAKQSGAAQTATCLSPYALAADVAGEETTLVSPSSYQQYLSLTDPMDGAATTDYMAIADGNAIYVYDARDGEYRKYEHTLNVADPSKNNIMNLQFYGDDQLYFLDGTYLYLLNPETLQVDNVSITESDPKFPCDTF